MGYVPPTPIDSYPPMPCSELMTPNEVRRALGYSECTMGEVVLYADNKIVASYSEIVKECDIQKPKNCNCPNCGAPVTGPICEYCGSILDQAEIDRQERELVEKRRQYEELLRQWQRSRLHFPEPKPFIDEQVSLKEVKQRINVEEIVGLSMVAVTSAAIVWAFINFLFA